MGDAPTTATEPAPQPTPEQLKAYAEQIERFLLREQQTAAQHKTRAKRDETFRQSLPLANGLARRVTRFDPQAIPTE